MLIIELTTTNYPFLKITDTVEMALNLIEQYHSEHLPVLNEDKKYLGLISKADLDLANAQDTISVLTDKLIKVFVRPQDHLLIVLKIMTLNDISLIAVADDLFEYKGVITKNSLLQACGKFVGADQQGGIIVFEVDKKSLSLSEIARIVETNDAFITQLNTKTNHESGLIEVCIKINRSDISAVVATLQRYDYIVKYYSGEEKFENEIKENYDMLMMYLKL